MSTRHDYCRAQIQPAVTFESRASSGLSNEEAESYIAYKLQELRRSQENFCVVFFNIDNLDAIDASYGDGVSTQLKESVYKSIYYNIRPSDHFSYWEDKGFIGVFEVNKEYEATLLADKIRYLVEGSVVPQKMEDSSISVAIGVTMANEDDTIAMVVDRAHDVMLQCDNTSGTRISSDA